MAQYNDLSVLDGLVKKVYGKGVHQAVPDNIASFFTDFPFCSNQERLGDVFAEAVSMSLEQGITRASDTAGAFALNNSIASVIKQALVHGSVIVNQATMSWDVAAKAKSANTAQSFANSMTTIIDNLILGHRRAQVVDMLYGGTNVGIIATGVASAVQTIVPGSCAAGVFYGSQNALFDIYSSDLTTKRNGSPLSLANFAVDPAGATRSLTFAASVTSTTGDVVVPAATISGAAYTTPPGLSVIAGTIGGTLFGLSQTTYPLFQPAVYSAASGPLSMALLDKASQLLLIRGVVGKMKLYCSPMQFSNLAQEEASRIHLIGNQTSGNLRVGFTGLQIACSNGSVIEVQGSPWIKEGEAYLLANDNSLRRIGSTDIQLGAPSDNQGSYWRRIEGSAGYSIVSFSLQAMFTAQPWKLMKITNIVST